MLVLLCTKCLKRVTANVSEMAALCQLQCLDSEVKSKKSLNTE